MCYKYLFHILILIVIKIAKPGYLFFVKKMRITKEFVSILNFQTL